MSTHHLIVTAEPLRPIDLDTMTAEEQAEYLADPDLDFSIECSGADSTCFTWYSCGCEDADYATEAADRDEDPADTADMLPCKKDGVSEHRRFCELGLATKRDQCYVARNDYLMDAASEAIEAKEYDGPGRYLVDFDVPDETDLRLILVDKVAS